LREALRFPLRDRDKIIARQQAVGELLQKPNLLKNIRLLLKDLSDIERICSRL
jgi:DNA mismatch repair ATPase MutS